MDGGARAMGWLQVFMFSLRPRALIRRVALEKGISRSFRDARTPLSPLLNPGSLPLKYALEHPALAHSARILAQADSVPLLGGSPPGLTGRNKLFLLHLSYLSLSFFLESFPFFFLFFLWLNICCGCLRQRRASISRIDIPRSLSLPQKPLRMGAGRGATRITDANRAN